VTDRSNQVSKRRHKPEVVEDLRVHGVRQQTHLLEQRASGQAQRLETARHLCVCSVTLDRNELIPQRR
jgi:hypothetical protein